MVTVQREQDRHLERDSLRLVIYGQSIRPYTRILSITTEVQGVHSNEITVVLIRFLKYLLDKQHTAKS